MQSRNEQKTEQRWFYVWLGIAAAAHVAVVLGVVLFQFFSVRMHPPLKVVNVSLVSMPGKAGSAGGPKSLPVPPAPVAKPKAPEPQSEPIPKPEPKAPEAENVKAVPDKASVVKIPKPEKLEKKKTPEKKSPAADQRQHLKATLDKLKQQEATRQRQSVSGSSSISSTLARLRKKVESEGAGTASSGSGSGAGGGRYGSGDGGAFDPYKAEIVGIIQSNWKFSSRMVRTNAGMEVYVSINILPDGSLRDIRYDRKSSSEYLNNSVRLALENSAPFPPLPAEYGVRGIWVGFVFTPKGIGQ